MSSETLLYIASAALSLGFSYIPNLNVWYAKLGENPDGTNDGGTRKRLVMLSLLVGIASATFGMSCLGWGGYYNIALECTEAGLAELLETLVLAIVANQATYQITPKTAAVRKALGK